MPLTDYPDWVLGQDILAWAAQGEMADRSTEHLAETDRGLILYRRMLDEQIKVVEAGGDPLNVFRQPHGRIDLEMEDYGPLVRYQRGMLQHTNAGPLNTELDVLDEFLFRTAAAWQAAGAVSPHEQPETQIYADAQFSEVRAGVELGADA